MLFTPSFSSKLTYKPNLTPLMAIWHAPFNGEQLKCKEPKFSKNATSTCLDTISDFRKKTSKYLRKQRGFVLCFWVSRREGRKRTEKTRGVYSCSTWQNDSFVGPGWDWAPA
jgi:hypothetical protein